MTLKTHVDDLARGLLARFAAQIERAAADGSADAIHDLRVSIRRLSQCLRIFSRFFPIRPARKIRGHMRRIIKLAGEVRNRDIALDLLKEAGLDSRGAVAAMLNAERRTMQADLTNLLRAFKKRDVAKNWPGRLGIGR